MAAIEALKAITLYGLKIRIFVAYFQTVSPGRYSLAYIRLFTFKVPQMVV